MVPYYPPLSKRSIGEEEGGEGGLRRRRTAD